MLEKLGVEAREVRLPVDLDGVNGLILPGGESTAMRKLLHRWELVKPIKALAKRGAPILGTCAGAILLATKIVDGDEPVLSLLDVEVRRNAFGRQVDSFEMDLEVQGIGGTPFPAVFIRAPWVEQVGDAVQVLSTINSGPRAGTIVAVQQGPLLATSFHPELTGDVRIHATFVELVRQYA